MLYGLSTHLFAYELLRKSHLDMIADNGFSIIEIFSSRMQIDFDDNSQLKEIAKGVDQNNLMVNSVHAPFYFNLESLKNKMFVNIASVDEDYRKKSVEEIKSSMVLATLFPVDYYVIHFPYVIHRDSFLKSLEELFAFAEHLQVKLAFENIPGENTSVSSIVKFFDENLVPAGICFDTGHANIRGTIYDDIEEYGVNFFTMHVHDNSGDSDSHLVPFEGGIDWKRIKKALKQVDYKWGFILEVRMSEQSSYNKLLKQAYNAIERFKKIEIE